jgi:glyoxylate reductase
MTSIHTSLTGGGPAPAMKPRIFISRPIQQVVVDRLAQCCEVKVHDLDDPIAIADLLKMVPDLDGLMPCGQKVPAEVIAAAPRLRVIANIGMGFDNIDIAACNARRIVVTNTPDVLTDATADIAFALLIAVARRIVEGDRIVREKRWPHWQWNFLWGSELNHRTLGLYGFGRIAQATARRGRGFGMRILYHARHRVAPEIERELNAELVDLNTLLRESDFLSVHVPLSLETHHSIGKAQLELMKPSAYLVNTARGSVLDEEALVQALRSRRIAGAGLDVYEHEPQVHPALLEMQNVVLAPHVGSATEDARMGMATRAADNLLAFFDGRRPPHVVNPEVLDEK